MLAMWKAVDRSFLLRYLGGYTDEWVFRFDYILNSHQMFHVYRSGNLFQKCRYEDIPLWPPMIDPLLARYSDIQDISFKGDCNEEDIPFPSRIIFQNFGIVFEILRGSKKASIPFRSKYSSRTAEKPVASGPLFPQPSAHPKATEVPREKIELTYGMSDQATVRRSFLAPFSFQHNPIRDVLDIATIPDSVGLDGILVKFITHFTGA